MNPTKTDRIFELGVYDETGEHTIPLRDLLNHPDEPTYDEESSLIILRKNDQEFLRDDWNLGSLSRITAQLIDVTQRLSRDETGILRSAIMDEQMVPLVLFEPTSRGTNISEFFVRHPDLSFQFPDEKGSNALYEWVLQGEKRPKRKFIVQLDTVLLLKEIKVSMMEASELLGKK